MPVNRAFIDNIPFNRRVARMIAIASRLPFFVANKSATAHSTPSIIESRVDECLKINAHQISCHNRRNEFEIISGLEASAGQKL